MSTFRRGIWLEIFAVNQLLGELLARSMRDGGREFALYSTLLGMGEATPTEFAKVLGLPLTTASDRLNRLVERGHATRSVNPRDGRSYVFGLTEEGERLTREQGEQFRTVITRVRSRLTVDEERIRESLDAVEAALRAELEDTETPPGS